MFCSCVPCIFVCVEAVQRFSYAFRVNLFSCRVICGVRRSMKWSLCSPKWMDIGTSGANSTQRSSNFKWDELTCARWEVLNNRLQLALTSLVLDNAGSQQNCAVRHADIANQINGTLETTLPSSRTSFRNGSDRARCHGGTEPTQDEPRSKHVFLSAMPRNRNNITTFLRVTQLALT